MKYSFACKLYGFFYHQSCKKILAEKYGRGICQEVRTEYQVIVLRAKEIGNSRLLSAYMMAAYFIALNRSNKLSAQENYELFRDGLYANKLFHMALGNGDSYLDRRKFAKRKEWERKSHERKYGNDWVVDVLDQTESYDLGYNYYECGICKLCRDEGCFELARYLCRLDFVLADIMGMRLERSMTLAEGGAYCDFRYSRK